jgi:hypothetical protein
MRKTRIGLLASALSFFIWFWQHTLWQLRLDMLRSTCGVCRAVPSLLRISFFIFGSLSQGCSALADPFLPSFI